MNTNNEEKIIDQYKKKTLDYIIPVELINKEVIEKNKELEKGLRVGDIKDIEKSIIIDQSTQKPILKTAFIDKIIQEIKPKLHKPELEVNPNVGIFVTVGVTFGDGFEFYGMGEVMFNGGNPGQYPTTLAYSRAIRSAISRGIGLYSVITDEDDEQEKLINAQIDIEVQSKMGKAIEELEKELDKKYKEKYEEKIKELEKNKVQEKPVENNSNIVEKIAMEITIPNTDDKYPNQKIFEIEDIEYLQKMRKKMKKENQIMSYIIGLAIQKLNQKELEKKEKKAKTTGLASMVKKGNIGKKEEVKEEIEVTENIDEANKEKEPKQKKEENPFGFQEPKKEIIQGVLGEDEDWMEKEMEKLKKETEE